MNMSGKEMLFLLVFFLANIIQAITGFAGTMLAMPASMMLIGVTEAKAILNALGLLVCLWIAIQNYKKINWRQFAKIAVFMFVGMIGGMLLFRIAPLPVLLRVYAVLIILIALKKLLVKKQFTLPQWMLLLVLLAAGVVHGMFVSGGALLVVYAVSVFQDKSEFRATLAPVWVLLNSFMLGSHILDGAFTLRVTALSLICIPPLIGSVILGNLLHKKINQKLFLTITYLLLLISGIMLLR